METGARTLLIRGHEPYFRHRFRDHQLLHGGHGRRGARCHSERGGRAHDPVGGRIHEDGGARRRTGRQAAGRHQSAQHDLFREAPHRPQIHRGPRGGEAHAFQGRRGQERRRLHRGPARRQDGAVCPPADLRVRPGQAEGGRRGLPRRKDHAGGHHGAGVLQRLAAPGDQGRRQDRGPRGPSHHQRAHGGFAGLRPRQEEGREDRGVRPGRRDVRRVRARDRRRRLRGQGDQRGHAPGRRQLG